MTAASKSKPDERGIMMAGAMARAAWDGTKTQARRPVKPQPDAWRDDPYPSSHPGEPGLWVWPSEETGCAQRIESPYGKRGDLLFVKETARVFGREGKPLGQYQAGGFKELGVLAAAESTRRESEFEYDVANGNALERNRPWRPSILMPKTWARTWLEILNVRVERVSEISEEDAKAEGCAVRHLDGIECGEYLTPVAGKLSCASGVSYSHRECFAALWNDLYASKGLGWDANPYVWVYEFRKLEGRP